MSVRILIGDVRGKLAELPDESVHSILIELNPQYAAMAERRIAGDAGMFADVMSA